MQMLDGNMKAWGEGKKYCSQKFVFTPNSSHALSNPKPNQPKEAEVEQMDGGESSRKREAFSGNEGN